jgi:hypothetical protein
MPIAERFPIYDKLQEDNRDLAKQGVTKLIPATSTLLFSDRELTPEERGRLATHAFLELLGLYKGIKGLGKGASKAAGLGAAFNGLKENLKEGVRNAGASGARITEVILNPNGGVGVLSPSGVVTVVSGAVSVAAEAAVEIAVVGQSSVSALTGLTSVAGLPTAMHMAKGKDPAGRITMADIQRGSVAQTISRICQGLYDPRVKGLWKTSKGYFDNDNYHTQNATALKSAAPKSPLEALDKSISVPKKMRDGKAPDRVYYDKERDVIAIFKHQENYLGEPVFHGFEMTREKFIGQKGYNDIKSFLHKEIQMKIK